MLRNLNRSLHENGLYVLGTQATGFIFSFIRNYMIARKLHVKKIRIGPGAYLRGLCFVKAGEDFNAGGGLWLEAITKYNDQTFSPQIIIGDHVYISHFVHIAATNYIEIGNNVLMGSKVMITDHNHGQYSKEHSSPNISPFCRPLDHDRQVKIGKNVWLSDGVVVTPGSSIGEGCVIGANSVVQGIIPPFTIAAGIPAKVRKTFNFQTNTWRNVE